MDVFFLLQCQGFLIWCYYVLLSIPPSAQYGHQGLMFLCLLMLETMACDTLIKGFHSLKRILFSFLGRVKRKNKNKNKEKRMLLMRQLLVKRRSSPFKLFPTCKECFELLLHSFHEILCSKFQVRTDPQGREERVSSFRPRHERHILEITSHFVLNPLSLSRYNFVCVKQYTKKCLDMLQDGWCSAFPKLT